MNQFNGSENYLPQSGYRYGWSIAQDQFVRKFKTFATSSWAGIISLPAPGTVQWDTVQNVGQPVVVGEGPYYYIDPARVNTDYTYNLNPIPQGADHEYISEQHTESTWYGKKTYYTTLVDEVKSQNINTSTIKTDRPIAVRFLGGGQGNVQVNSSAGILLDGLIQNPTGTTTLFAGSGIRQLSEGAAVGGQRVVLVSGGPIGSAASPIHTAVNATPAFDFTTTKAAGSAGTSIIPGNLVRVNQGYQGGGDPGSVYTYLGQPALARSQHAELRHSRALVQGRPQSQPVRQLGRRGRVRRPDGGRPAGRPGFCGAGLLRVRHGPGAAFSRRSRVRGPGRAGSLGQHDFRRIGDLDGDDRGPRRRRPAAGGLFRHATPGQGHGHRQRQHLLAGRGR